MTFLFLKPFTYNEHGRFYLHRGALRPKHHPYGCGYTYWDRSLKCGCYVDSGLPPYVRLYPQNPWLTINAFL